MDLNILIGSPVRQKPAILKHFLSSLGLLDPAGAQIDYYFTDDNQEAASTQLLKEFSDRHPGRVTLIRRESDEPYVCDQNTHFWKANLIRKVAGYKNEIIAHCLRNNYDYLLLIDSDLVLHPQTLNQLISDGKDIVSEIFWTRWKKNLPYLPQVWLFDQYDLAPRKNGEVLDSPEYEKRKNEFLRTLLKPGIYEVGGLGACTLISRRALEKGLSFQEVPNISFTGEDRHFCIRAAALGIGLFVDTHYPACHLYREEDIAGIEVYRKGNPLMEAVAQELVPVNIQSQIENLIICFFSQYLSCDYRIYTGFEGLSLLSPKLKNRFEKSRENIMRTLQNSRLRCKSELRELAVYTVDEAGGVVHANCDFVFDFSGQNTSDRRNYKAALELSRTGHNAWIVDYISFSDKDGGGILGFTAADLAFPQKRICKAENNKLTLAMLVRNEAGSYLSRILAHAAEYVDDAVILDDASTDNTTALCKEILKDLPHRIVSNSESGFHNEINLRKQLWDLTVQSNPDWILCLDADELFEDSIQHHIRSLINQASFDYYTFRLYDMWDENHYREDAYWQAHRYFRPFLVRYQPCFGYTWQETPQHCGRFPNNLELLNGCPCSIRLKHYGWATEELRKRKFERYMQLDPGGIYGNINQYRSICDANPRLIRWE